MWNKVTIKMFMDILSLEDSNATEFEKIISRIAILSGNEEDHFDEMTYGEVLKFAKPYKFFTDFEIPTKLPEVFKVNDRTFTLTYKINKLTASQYIDLTTYGKGSMKEVNENIHNLLAVISKPKEAKYKDETIDERAEYFYEHLTMDIAYPVAVFFCNLFSNLTVAIQDYLEVELPILAQEMKEAMEDTHSIGAGL